MRDLCTFLEVPFDEAVLRPYEGERMTDGVYSRSLSIGDPNFHNHDRIDAALGDTWSRIRLSRRLTPATCTLATELRYPLPQEEADASSRPSEALSPVATAPSASASIPSGEQTVLQAAASIYLSWRTGEPGAEAARAFLVGRGLKQAILDRFEVGFALEGADVLEQMLRGRGHPMEALVAASIAALTIYDMLKALSHDIVIGPVELLAKAGGRRGTIRRSAS